MEDCPTFGLAKLDEFTLLYHQNASYRLKKFRKIKTRRAGGGREGGGQQGANARELKQVSGARKSSRS